MAAVEQLEHEQIYPKPGWVEHDPNEIWQRTRQVMDGALGKVGGNADDIAALGITNQRETTVVWDRNTGEPVHNAIVWQDTRTDKICDELSADEGQDRFRLKTGLPIATYFSGPKIRWILENVDGARERAEAGDLIFGNTDTWSIWNLTGGTDGGLHITDPSNASRTMLMNLETLDWDDDAAVGHRRAALDAPGDQAVERRVRRGQGRRLRGRAGGRRPRRPAGGHLRPDLLLGRRGEEHLRHRQLPAAQHGHGGGAVEERADHHGGLQDRRRRRGLLPRGLDRDHRGARAVAARQPQDHPLFERGRGPCEERRGQRRGVHRARVLGAVRARTGSRTRAASLPA